MKRNSTSLSWILTLLFTLLLLSGAWAADPAGTVLTLTGSVSLQRAGQTMPVQAHQALFSGDTLITNEGQVQIRFRDQGLLTLYRNSRFAIDAYQYNKGKQDRAHFSLLKGLMHTLTGEMDKRNYLLKTRLAELGVRGTEFSTQMGNQMLVNVVQGQVILRNSGGSLIIPAGGSALVSSPSLSPQPSNKRIELHSQGMGPRRGSGMGNGQGGNGPDGGQQGPSPQGQRLTKQLNQQHAAGAAPPAPPPPGPPPPGPPGHSH